MLSLINRISFIFLVIVLLFTSSNNGQNKNMQPPTAEKIKKELTIHGHTRIDNYYWLNQRENPKVLDYLKAENDYTSALMKHTEPLQEKIYNEIIARIKQDDQSVPYKKNSFFYFDRYVKEKEYPIYCRKKETLKANEEILLDVNEMAKGYSYFNAASLQVSPNNKILAFGVDTLSRRIYEIKFKDLTSGKFFEDKIPNTTGNAVWANDNKTIFYTTKDSTLRPFKIFKHTLGTDSKFDKEIYHEKDETFGAYVYKSKSDDYLIIASNQTLSNEFRFLKADNPDGEFKIFQAREKNLEYRIDHFEKDFYIVTNYQAKNFRLMKTSIDNTSKENWKEVIPHRKDVLLEDIEIFKDFLVVREREKGLTKMRIINWKSKDEHYLNFGEPAYAAYFSVNLDFSTDLFRFGYTSLKTPYSTFDYNMKTKKKNLLKQTEILGGFKADDYKTERLYAKAKDGAEIPISLIYKKGLKKNGNNPLLLYGYGSYGISTDAVFNSANLSLLNRGFVYAIAHIRGGEELGREWYENGKLFKKKNTFLDFIDCGDFLIEQKFTNKNKIFALGGSAGGLLMGAVINIRPDLFKGVIASVPFVDVVTTMLDESIPLTTAEYDEWGNPNEKDYYDYMLSYSPYDNVEAKGYPNLLVLTGLHDSQVQYFEPAKWVAKLRVMKTDKNLLLFKTNMDAGHSGVSGRFRAYKDVALRFAFMFDLAGIKE